MWEIPPSSLSGDKDNTSEAKLWRNFAKGGEYSPYFQDLHLAINWAEQGRELKAYPKRVSILPCNWLSHHIGTLPSNTIEKWFSAATQSRIGRFQ